MTGVSSPLYQDCCPDENEKSRACNCAVNVWYVINRDAVFTTAVWKHLTPNWWPAEETRCQYFFLTGAVSLVKTELPLGHTALRRRLSRSSVVALVSWCHAIWRLFNRLLYFIKRLHLQRNRCRGHFSPDANKLFLLFFPRTNEEREREREREKKKEVGSSLSRRSETKSAWVRSCLGA